MKRYSVLIPLMCLLAFPGCGGSGSNGTSQGGTLLRTVVGPHYTATIITPFPGDNTLSAAGLNNMGQVIGTSQYIDLSQETPRPAYTPPPGHPYLVSQGIQTHLPITSVLSDPYPVAINDLGVIIGKNGGTPIVWQNGSVSALPGMSGLQNPDLIALNNKGVILINTFDSFLWTSGVLTKLPPNGGAYGLNDAGAVVGAGNLNTAGIWQNGTYTVLPYIGAGPVYSSAIAFAINNKGQVVGRSEAQYTSAQWEPHAVLWQHGQLTDLNPVLNAVFSEAHYINNQGEVAGFYSPINGINLGFFLYKNGSATDISKLLPPGVSMPDDANIAALNDRGEILIYGSHNCILLSPNGQ